jgi:hypothetical protein
MVPGTFRRDVAYLDIETLKVPIVGYVMANGEPLRNRWQAFWVGVAVNGSIRLVKRTTLSDETYLNEVRLAMSTAPQVVYSATRQFDEMILKGRFTNARRAHAEKSFYHPLPGAENLDWKCMPPHHVPRAADDLPGRDVPAAWGRGDESSIRTHLLRDVAELVLLYGEPDDVCASWCRKMLGA